jgi:hypothetical protein
MSRSVLLKHWEKSMRALPQLERRNDKISLTFPGWFCSEFEDDDWLSELEDEFPCGI